MLADTAAFERKYSEISQFCLANIEQAQNARSGNAKAGSLYKAYSVCGTPQYMSPEVIAQQGHDMQSDWWALGIVMYELATGNPPFVSKDLEAMADNIRFADLPTQSHFSDEFENLVMRLTSKLPAKRLGKNGSTEIKNHPFFRNVKWDKVLKKQLKPPIIPQN